ncbi:MAG: glycoside hydrolase family 78 protein [Verrucomicrobia bacterium]|nr:glycoside hydrolase family 78 protein [Verrucomicrobiota bacterium]
MNPIVTRIAAGLLAGIAMLTCLSASVAEPSRLRCEYLVDPLGIDVAKPRLSWVIEERSQSSEDRGQKQSGYQVLVASTPESLAKDQGDLWDSGKVESDQSIQVEYSGKLLGSRLACHWKVRVWDKGGKASAWSAPAGWSMGLLNPQDFKAKWIGAPTDAPIEPAPLLRKTFSLDKKIERATAYISGLGYYELTLNGQKVGDHVLDPKFTRYDRRVLYVTYDMTRQLKNGNNAMGVMLGNGWYNYHVKNPWSFDTAPWRAKPKMLLQLEIAFADGSTQTIISDESWKYSTGPIQFDGMLSGEVYDARLEKEGWNTAGYDDSKWVAAKVVDAPKGKLSAQMVQPIRVTEVLKPVKVSQPKPGVYLYDMGQNIAGTARLAVTGPAGTEVKIQYAELLHDDGTLNPDRIKVFCQSAEFQTERYVLKGKGTEIWQSRFMYHGFQYVQVTGFPGEPKLADLEALVMHTDLENAGTFECSNELLNKIQHCTRWSYLNNFHGHPTDCPNREKIGWTGDAHVAAETGLYNFDASAAYTQWMLDFKDEQRDSGELPGIVPTGGWGYQWGGGPGWTSAYVLIPWYMYQYRGDIRLLAEHYENLKRYVDYLTSMAKNGIVGIDPGDWSVAKTETPVEVTSTGYYYCDAVIVSKMAGILGQPDDAAKYAQLAAAIRQAFNREFLNGQTKQYANGSQTALSCALYQGLVEPADVDTVLDNLVANVEMQGNHLDCGILGTKYLLHVLANNGRADVAFKVTAQTTQPSWGYWIKQGATTLWEKWDDSDGSHNHVMFGDVSAWFFKSLAGICPDESGPGFKKIIIKPAIVGDLTWVKCGYDSIHGRIVSNWKLDAGKLTMEVTIPMNTTATVYVPSKDAAGVTESNKLAARAQGVKFLRMENGAAVYEVGSGTYRFQSTLTETIKAESK